MLGNRVVVKERLDPSCYIGFIVIFTKSAIEKQEASNIIWPAALLVAILPLLGAISHMRNKIKELEHAAKDMPPEAQKILGGPEKAMLIMIVKSEFLTFLITLIGIFIFYFYPEMMKSPYGWLLRL